MPRSAWLALVASVLLPFTAHAQAMPATQQGFGFCTVTDNSSAQIKIWASPVFPLEFASDDHGASRRTIEVANEFLAHVGTLGGIGTKMCLVMPTQDEATAFREEQRAPWSKRMYFIKLGDWRDVAWTPAPLKPGAAAASDAPVTRYFLCQAMQTDLPDRSARSRTMASGVFAQPVPSDNPVAMYEQAKAYATQFQAIVQAHGLPVQGDCTPYDSAGEAQYAYQQMKRLADGFNQEYTEVAWTPQAQAAPAATMGMPTPVAVAPKPGTLGVRIGPVTAELALGLGRTSTEGAWVVEVLDGGAAKAAGIRPMDVLLEIAGQMVTAPTDVSLIVSRLNPGFEAPVRIWRERKMQDISVVIPPSTANAGATPDATPPPSAPAVSVAPPDGQGWYCTAAVSRSSPAMVARLPVRKQAGPAYSEAAARATLFSLIASVKQSHPGGWHDLEKAQCYDNGMVFPGERFCVATSFKRFGGGTQVFGLYCNASRDMADKRWEDMKKSDGDHAQVLAWPSGS